jgi:hypothetical protein
MLWLVPLALAVIGGVTAGTGAGAPARIIDRTFVCTPSASYGGAPNLDVVTSPRGGILLHGTVRAISVGYVGVSSGADVATSDLVIVRARTQERYQQQPQPPGVYVNAPRCSRVRTTVPLSPRGLPGPPVRFGTEGKCAVRGRVLVRVRTVLQAPTSWLPAEPPYAGARRNVVAAKVAIRSQRSHEPLGLIELDSAGKTKLWTSGACS